MDGNNLLSGGDVISAVKNNAPLPLYSTFKVSEFLSALAEQVKRNDNFEQALTSTGLECEVLVVGAHDWQKGRVRISLEFIPDQG